jgi:hypothetical protein
MKTSYAVLTFLLEWRFVGYPNPMALIGNVMETKWEMKTMRQCAIYM